MHLTCKPGFENIDISRLGPECAYCYFPEDTIPEVLFRDIVSIKGKAIPVTGREAP
jgi:hypothetical protein